MVCPLRSRLALPITLALAVFLYGRLVSTKPELEKIAGHELEVRRARVYARSTADRLDALVLPRFAGQILDLRPLGWTLPGAVQFFKELKPAGRVDYGTNIWAKDILGPLALHSFFTSVIMNLWRRKSKPAADGSVSVPAPVSPLVRFATFAPLLSFGFDMIENYSIWVLLAACGNDSPNALSANCAALSSTATIGSIGSQLKWSMMIPIITAVVAGVVRLVRRRCESVRQHNL